MEHWCPYLSSSVSGASAGLQGEAILTSVERGDWYGVLLQSSMPWKVFRFLAYWSWIFVMWPSVSRASSDVYLELMNSARPRTHSLM